jgi:hypothetical protein
MSVFEHLPGRRPTAVAPRCPAPPPAGEGLLRRGFGAALMLAIALVHLLALPGTFAEARYLGIGYLGLILASVGVAEMLLRRDSLIAWRAAGLLAGATLFGFATDRTVGLPGATADIGNWLDPLGLASLFVESLAVGLAMTALARSDADTPD